MSYVIECLEACLAISLQFILFQMDVMIVLQGSKKQHIQQAAQRNREHNFGLIFPAPRQYLSKIYLRESMSHFLKEKSFIIPSNPESNIYSASFIYYNLKKPFLFLELHTTWQKQPFQLICLSQKAKGWSFCINLDHQRADIYFNGSMKDWSLLNCTYS